MKKKIFEALATKFEGVDAKVLDRIAEKLSKTVKEEEEVQTAVDGVTFQSILESYADSRVNEAVNTAVVNYEKKYGLKEGKPLKKEEDPDPNKKPAEPPTEEIPAYIKALMEQNKQLAEQISAINSERQVTSRKKTLQEMLKNAPQKLRERYEKDFERLSFKDDEDFKSWVDEVSPEVQSLTEDFNKRISTITPPKGNRTIPSTPTNSYLSDRLKEEAESNEVSAIKGLSSADTKK